MPVWSVSEPYISLWLHDEPLGYQPAIGPRISFELAFKQRESVAGWNTNLFSVGKKWDFAWFSFVSRDYNSNNVVFYAGGGQRTFYTTNDYLTGGTIAGDTTNGFTVSNPDGSQDVYKFIVTNRSGVFLEAFLTQHWNPQAQKTTFNYYNYTPNYPDSVVIRLKNVVDGDGRTNSISYATNNAYSTNLISQVVDPFGRTTMLLYDGTGHLTNITDVVNNSTAIAYDTNDWVISMTTPYGNTAFAITDSGTNNIPPNGRSVLVTQPDFSHHLYLYEDKAAGVTNAYPSGAVPSTGALSNTLDNSDLNLRNTFHWGPRQYANLSTTNIASFLATDFRLAQMKHWLLSTTNIIGGTVSLERDPSPDNGGATEGQKTWYDYAGKTNSEYEGTQVEPLYVARVLPDGTSSFTRTDRNTLDAGTTNISTYSANGTVLLRTNIYVYAPNQIDLLVATNALGVQVSSNSYNAYHEVTNSYDATNELTVYTYDGSNRLSSATLPNGLVTTYAYGSDDFLATRIDTNFDTNSFTYTNDLVFTHTDARGLTVTNTWDNLNRLTRTAFPDGTAIANTYNRLDLVQTADRMGFTNSFGYDSMQRMIAQTNSLGAVTIYNYCTCGALESTVDAANNTNQFLYDNEGDLTSALYADGYGVTNAYNLLQQVVSTRDSGGNSVTNTYNNQGLLTTVNNAFGQVQSTAYDVLGRATNTVDANGVSVATSFDNLNRPLNRSYPDSGVEHWGYTLNVSGATSYTNQIGNIVTYVYDTLGRQTTNTVLGVTTTIFTYDGASDRLTLTDGKSQATTWTYDLYGNVSNKVDAAGNLIFVYKYDLDNRLTNRWSVAKGNTTYKYDAAGNLMNIVYPVSPSITLAYDVLNHLTNMVDAVGTTIYSYDSVGELLSEAGPWANDTVSYTYASRLRTGLSLGQPSGSWSQSYGYDVTRRLTNVTSQSGSFGYTYPSTTFQVPSAVSLPNGAWITNTFDGNTRLLSTILKNSAGTVLDFESYAYNQASQRTAETNTTGDFRNYAYDNEGELTSAIGKEAGGTTNRWQEQLGYGYDAAGNLNYRTNNTYIQTFTVNDLNELSNVTRSGTITTVAGTTTTPATNVTVNGTSASLYADSTFAATNISLVNGTNTFTAVAQDSSGRVSSNTVTAWMPAVPTYAYDLNGNLLLERNAAGTITNRNFAYDDENQLISVWAANSRSNSFVYDGKFRRRIEKDYSWNGGSWTQTNEIHFIYDGNAVIQERDANNNPLVTYTRSGGSLLARTDYGQEIPGSPTTAYYHTDGNGNITVLIYANQVIAAKYLYDPFGNTLSLIGPLAPLNSYRFAAKEWNNSAGIYYFGRRYYDPMLQRFINRDPLAEQGGLNLYTYVGNNPVSLLDILGLCPPNNSLPSWLQPIPLDDSFWNLFAEGIFNTIDSIPNSMMDIGIRVPVDTIGMAAYSVNGNPQDFVPWSQTYQNVFQESPEQAQANILMGTLLTEGTLVIPGALNATAARFTAAAGEGSFFEGATYSSKVLQQMSGGAGEFHSFPESVTAFEDSGTVSTITGGDGKTYQMLEIPGSYQGAGGTWYNGSFQFMKDTSGVINHRLFVPSP